MSVDDSIKSQVKAHMRRGGTTQKELADKLGIRQPSVAAALGKTTAINQGFAEILDALGLELTVQPKTVGELPASQMPPS
jgi:predicted XRE-type DNA-binding protein